MRILKKLARACIPKRFHPTTIFPQHIVAVAKGTVMAGPFKGMHYINRSFGSQFFPKLMGTYELELTPVLAQLATVGFDHVVVAGSAEGYYAVGMARWPKVEKVDTFEAQPEAHIALLELAELNQVAAKIEQHGLCDCSQLSMLLQRPKQTLLVVDIEGGESILLDPQMVPALREATLLVEMHECFLPGLGALIESRFAPSHEITRINALARTLDDLPSLISAPPSFLRGAALVALDEGRPPGMYWLLLRPLATSTGT